jgi:ribosomal protein L17
MPHTAHFRRLIASSSSHRSSLLRNLVSSLILHESITTTLTKAKAVQPYAEKVITMGKKFVGRRDQRERATAYVYVLLRLPPSANIRIGRLRCRSCLIHLRRGIGLEKVGILGYIDYLPGMGTWRLKQY